MLRKLIILIASLIICLPLSAASQVQIDTAVDGQLIMKKYYSTISEETDITNGLFYIDGDGINSDLASVDNPFSIRDGFTTDDFIVTFFGSVEMNQTYQIDVSCSSYYYILNTNKNYISHSPSIINKSPSNGILSYITGEYYDLNDPNINKYSFQIDSETNSSVPAGRYFTDITISLVEL